MEWIQFHIVCAVWSRLLLWITLNVDSQLFSSAWFVYVWLCEGSLKSLCVDCACMLNGADVFFFLYSLWKYVCLVNCLWLRSVRVCHWCLQRGGSWRAAHTCGALQHSGLRLHRGPSPCSNSCAVGLHHITRSQLVLLGTPVLQTDLLTGVLNCALLRVKKWLWAVDHDLDEMSWIWSLVLWQMKGKAVEALCGCCPRRVPLLVLGSVP